MQSEQINLKLQKDLFQEIELISKILHIPKNEWMRNVLAHEVKKEIEEHKNFLVREYLRGTVTKGELINVLGKKEVEDIERIIRVGRKSFDDAKTIAETMK